MNVLATILVCAILGSFWSNYTNNRFEKYRKRANERLARLEDAAEKHQWKLPRCSFGFFTEIDDFE